MFGVQINTHDGGREREGESERGRARRAERGGQRVREVRSIDIHIDRTACFVARSGGVRRARPNGRFGNGERERDERLVY